MKSKFLFGDIVVVNKNNIGVIVKCWESIKKGVYYEIYNRMTSKIEEHIEADIERYRIRHKYLDENEIYYQNS